MKPFEVISEDPYIYWPDPFQNLALPYYPEFALGALHARDAATLLKAWLVGCRPEIDAMGEERWVRYVDAHLPAGETLRYRDVEDFARFFVYWQVRSGIHVLDGRDVPFSAEKFAQVATDFRWVSLDELWRRLSLTCDCADTAPQCRADDPQIWDWTV
ncbi:MAG TPA: hypothetical protein VF647_02210 [Longimicrobium sp.]|jgi:hypothetical protein